MTDDMTGALINDKMIGDTIKTEKYSSFYKLGWAGAMLFSGTCTTILSKALYETSAEGSVSCNVDDSDDKNCSFDKPWFTVLVMKIAMATCLAMYYGNSYIF